MTVTDEQIDACGYTALSARGPRVINAEHEREIKCCQCRAVLIVGGFVDDLDPETYVGLSCGCRRPVEDGAPTNALEALGRARTAQEAVRG